MPTECRICADPRAAEINSALIQGETLKEVGARFAVSVASLSRHRRNHLGAADAPTGDLESQAAIWLNRADEIFSRAVIDGDVRGQVSALSAALRGLELKNRSAIRDTEKSGNPGEVTLLEYLDSVLAGHEEEIDAAIRRNSGEESHGIN